MFGQGRELHAVPCCPQAGSWCSQWSVCTAAVGIHTIGFHWPPRAAEHGFHSDTWKQKATLSRRRKQARKWAELWHQVWQKTSMAEEKRSTHTLHFWLLFTTSGHEFPCKHLLGTFKYFLSSKQNKCQQLFSKPLTQWEWFMAAVFSADFLF